MIVIGGGDTGADCIGTSLRHGCKSMINFELLDRPPAEPRRRTTPGPSGRGSSASTTRTPKRRPRFGHDPREYNILTKEFVDDGHGRVKGIKTVDVDWSKPAEKAPFSEVPGSEKIWPADLVLLATGFLGPELAVGEMLGLETHRARAATGKPSKPTTARSPRTSTSVFAAGDCRRGQSLVVWAINEGRGAARAVDEFLMGTSTLPAPGITQGMLAVK